MYALRLYSFSNPFIYPRVYNSWSIKQQQPCHHVFPCSASPRIVYKSTWWPFSLISNAVTIFIERMLSNIFISKVRFSSDWWLSTITSLRSYTVDAVHQKNYVLSLFQFPHFIFLSFPSRCFVALQTKTLTWALSFAINMRPKQFHGEIKLHACTFPFLYLSC